MRRLRRLFRPSRRHAFTMVEIAVVMVIAAVIAGGGMAVVVSVMERGKVEDTQAKFTTLARAMNDYAASKGHLPCPASLTATRGTASYGDGVGSGAVSANCSAASYSSGNIAIGAVPIRQLQLDREGDKRLNVDAEGNNIIYAVTRI